MEELYLCTVYPTYHSGRWGAGKASFYTDCGFFLTYPSKFTGRRVWNASFTIPPNAGVYCKNCKSRQEKMKHTVTIEKRRGFQPPWYNVRIYECSLSGIKTALRLNRGGNGPGAIIGNCGHLLSL